jgi:hypothetical protein
VWTGTQLFVFGGRNGFTSLNDGALYDPNANTWTVIAGSGRPSTRSGFFAYWNGSRAVVVGGIGAGGTSLRDVHLYDPVGASWTTGNSASVSAARAGVTTSSTQAFMLGGDTAGDCSAGSESNATQIASMPTPTWTNGTNVPGARFFGALLACSPDEWRAPWIETTGEVFMWGGVASGAYLASGSLYRPSDDTSHAIAAAPAPLAGGGFLPTAVWTGSVVLGWSASIPGTPTPTAVDVVYSYDPVANSWSVLNPSGGPAPIHEGPAYGWTGHELVVWGGRSGASTYSAQGARYAP